MDSYRGCKYGFRYSLLRKNGCSILYGCCSYFCCNNLFAEKVALSPEKSGNRLGGTMENKEQTLNPTEQSILEALRSLDYGEITITVHNGKPTIMEVSKKIKF